MKFALLTRFHSRHGQSSFVKRLVEESARVGHTFEVINPADVSLQFGNAQASVLWNGVPFPAFDLVHYALRWDDDHTWNVVEALKGMGLKVLPPNRVPMGDTITMTRLFGRANIKTPKTWIFNSASQLAMVLDELPFPCLFKVRKGGQGRRLYIAQHTGEAMSIADTLASSGHPFVVQEILAPTGTDIRVFVVGDRAVAGVERVAPAGFLWPKEEGNARVVPVQVTPDEEKLAVAAAKVYTAPYAAVNLLRRAGQPPMLLELSRAPTLTEVERTTGVNVAGEIVAYCARVGK